jgi:formylglycine-generating enzyme required for sulfatase activity/serine/threonine protein kinase
MNASAPHPTDEALRAYGLGRLDDAPAASVHSHLEGCPDCQRRVGELSSDSLRQMRAGSQPSGPAVSCTDGLSMPDKSPVPAAPPPAGTLPPGLADLPNYEILRELGRGGMGTVFLARNTLMGRMEVLKAVSDHLVNGRGIRDRFLGEIRNAARLNHPNIVIAHSAFPLGESLVLAMEYVEGLDLTRMVNARGPLPVANACNYAYQAALGLQHAHEHGMVHRDIKPGNLMLTRQGTRALIKVLDFGLAKVTSEGAMHGGLTHEGQMLGTPDYIAPEQIRNARDADIRADIYSLGSTLYHLLTGQPPFQGDNLYDILQAHHSMDATPLNLVRPEVPVEVAAIVAKMMAKEPGRRFQEPKDVAQALKPFFKSGNVAVQEQPAEDSWTGQKGSGGPVPGPVRTPNQPATLVEGPVGGPNPATEPSAPAAPWQSLIDLGAMGPPRDGTPTVLPRRVPPWAWPGVAASILLLGLVVAWVAGVFKVKTAHGVIVLENVPADAVVEVDGDRVTVMPKQGEPFKIEVQPGKHGVVVKRGKDLLLGESVPVASGKAATLTARIEPFAGPEPSEAPPVAGTTPVGEIVATERLRPIETPAERSNKVAIGGGTAPTLPAKTTPRSDVGPAARRPGPLESMTNSVRMTFHLIPAGEFMMGSANDDPEAAENEKPRHMVRLSAFYLGIYEVTQAEYETVMGNNPSGYRPRGRSTARHPVECVTSWDAVRFCNALSARENIPPYYNVRGEHVEIPDRKAPGYRLPTEAEWEYACRAGTTTRNYFGDDPSTADDYAWHHENRRGWTHPVGEKHHNAFGLFDMLGNVAEWCADRFDGGYYAQSPKVDPPGPPGDWDPATRGGSSDFSAPGFRSARRQTDAWLHDPRVGFRVARGYYPDVKNLSVAKRSGSTSSPAARSLQPTGGARFGVPLANGSNPHKSNRARSPRGDWTSPATRMGFVNIRGGTFTMGSPAEDKDASTNEMPPHPVRIGPFSLGVTEVTQEQYEIIMGDNPSYFSPTGPGRDMVAGQTSADLPAENISWLDAIRFCNAMSRKDGIAPYYRIDGEKVEIPDRKGPGYRLPTEAEWEHACRAGKTTRFSFGNDASALNGAGWYGENSAGRPHPVAQKAANDLGLYDMSGNVWEWCSDGWDEDYYKKTPEDDPPGAAGAASFVFRGGGWDSEPRECRCASRYRFAPGNRSYFLGFRVARSGEAR